MIIRTCLTGWQLCFTQTTKCRTWHFSSTCGKNERCNYRSNGNKSTRAKRNTQVRL